MTNSSARPNLPTTRITRSLARSVAALLRSHEAPEPMVRSDVFTRRFSFIPSLFLSFGRHYSVCCSKAQQKSRGKKKKNHTALIKDIGFNGSFHSLTTFLCRRQATMATVCRHCCRNDEGCWFVSLSSFLLFSLSVCGHYVPLKQFHVC